MQMQAKKVKGFSLLELIVVIAIIGAMSATAFGPFTKWRAERLVRSQATEVASMMRSIFSQVQRGQYHFVQIQIYRDKDTEEIVLETNGLKLNKFTDLVRDKWDGSTKKDFHEFDQRCSMDIDWDDEGSTSNELTVQQIRIDETKVLMGIANDESNKNDPIPDTGSKICFSKDGTYYSVSDTFYETSSAGFNLKENLYICQKALPDDSEEDSAGTYCEKDQGTKPIQANFFRVNWSRFGSINLYKWANDWVTQ